MKTPRQNNLGIITSLISLPINLMLVFPTLCLNLFLTCCPPILLLPSGLWRRKRPLACRFIRYRWFICLVRYLQFALSEEKRSLHEDKKRMVIKRMVRLEFLSQRLGPVAASYAAGNRRGPKNDHGCPSWVGLQWLRSICRIHTVYAPHSSKLTFCLKSGETEGK